MDVTRRDDIKMRVRNKFIDTENKMMVVREEKGEQIGKKGEGD